MTCYSRQTEQNPLILPVLISNRPRLYLYILYILYIYTLLHPAVVPPGSGFVVDKDVIVVATNEGVWSTMQEFCALV